MREIEFRGYDPGFNKWVYGDFVGCTESDKEKGYNPTIIPRVDIEELDSEWLMAWGYHSVDLETVGQYTGLKDKNGVKIFEGDICKYRYGRSTYIGKVVFNTRACIFEMRRTEIVGYHGERATKTQLLNHIDKVEVIGNIHDNPELLEAER